MLSQWIFHGELDDSYQEFFIALQSTADTASEGESLWNEKYIINEAMLPGFIPLDQAKKILSTGKAISLLVEVSNQHAFMSEGYEELKKAFEATEVELLFKESNVEGSEKGEFRKLLDLAYRETSLRARKILFEDYKLMSHLCGIRQFLLLGQGDFIRHLMDLLASELDRPARKLQMHALNGLLNSAIRATNAQFLDEDVINRVDSIVVVNGARDETTGWDIFTLTYQTKGPISTILTQYCMNKYSNLFRHLWRSKRMEYILSSLWKKQKRNAFVLRHIPRLSHLFHMTALLLSEMTHFVQQMQHYMEFEVIECSWAEFIKRIESSSDIDQLVEAHEWLMQVLLSRSMLSMESEHLNSQLYSIYSVIVMFKSTHEKLMRAVEQELEYRLEYDEYVRDAVRSGQDVPQDRADDETKRRSEFDGEILRKHECKLNMAAGVFQKQVQDFLLLLADHTDMDLQFLSVRLDFNEFYQRRNKCLETSLTYSHRLSIM